jgi:hypothetical protein
MLRAAGYRGAKLLDILIGLTWGKSFDLIGWFGFCPFMGC